MIISTYQMDVVGGNPEENRNRVQKWIEAVVQSENPDTVVLPELWTTSYRLEELNEIADSDGEPTKSFLKSEAKKHNINIVGGSFANKVGEKTYNTSVIINRKGKEVYEYNKIHTVPMLNEHLYLTGGQEKVKVFELDGIKMGVIICYDIRFPELARSLALQGAEVLFIVAQWPTPRKKHWIQLQIARAIENQMFVVTSNNIGNVDGTVYCGSSMIIDPLGDVLEQGSDFAEETISHKLDISRVAKARDQVPVFEGRVPHLYDI